jgi:putative SOS response-associated peptidase YedK
VVPAPSHCTYPIGTHRSTEAGIVRELSLVRWGLIPSWSKDSSGAAKMMNARSKTALTLPAFRNAMRSRRCLVPAAHFTNGKPRKVKQPSCFEVGGGHQHGTTPGGVWTSSEPSRNDWTFPITPAIGGATCCASVAPTARVQARRIKPRRCINPAGDG